MTPTPARHTKQGLYLANLGFVSKHLGQIGRPQHVVMNSSESSTLGGNDEEHARHRVVLRSNMSFQGGGFSERIQGVSRDGTGEGGVSSVPGCASIVTPLRMIENGTNNHLSKIGARKECTRVFSQLPPGRITSLLCNKQQTQANVRKHVSLYRYTPRRLCFQANKKDRT